MDFKPLKYIYRAANTEGAYTLLLLHGTGGDENDLLPIAEYFGKDINVLSLRGNVQEHGMPRFFRRLGMGVFDEDDLRFRTDELVAFLKDLADKEGFDLSKLVALGYSNGANIIGSVLVGYPGLLSGAVLYRAMQPFKELPNVDNTQETPVFMSNGRVDPTIAPGATEKYVAALQESGYDVAIHYLPVGHQLIQEDIKLSVAWFEQHYAKEKAGR